MDGRTPITLVLSLLLLLSSSAVVVVVVVVLPAAEPTNTGEVGTAAACVIGTKGVYSLRGSASERIPSLVICPPLEIPTRFKVMFQGVALLPTCFCANKASSFTSPPSLCESPPDCAAPAAARLASAWISFSRCERDHGLGSSSRRGGSLSATDLMSLVAW